MCQQLAFVTASHMYQAESAEKIKHVAEEHKGLSWAQMNANNMRLAKNLLQKGYVMNEGRPIGLSFQPVVFLTTGQEPSSDVSTPEARPPASGMSPGAASAPPAACPWEPPPQPLSLPASPPTPTSGAAFRLYTFGVRHLADRFPESDVAKQIFGMVNTRGTPKVPWRVLCGP